jgi:hypothetical protein
MKKCSEVRIFVRPTELGSRQVEGDPSQEDDGNLDMLNPRLFIRTKRTGGIPLVSLVKKKDRGYFHTFCKANGAERAVV